MTKDAHSVSRWLAFDRDHLWHPYSAVRCAAPAYPVVAAEGVRLNLADGRSLVDGMSSWWAAIHGYNHPVLNQALRKQSEDMAHVMFGGLTHLPAVELGRRLLHVLPDGIDTIFFCDSGSVAVEVAIKMALQYWFVQNVPERRQLLTVRHGYHGDTFGSMSVSDPDNGMHSMFSHLVAPQLFAMAPPCSDAIDEAVNDVEAKLERHHRRIAAVILEPVVQGAGGMRIYNPAYLSRLRQLCDKFETLLIFDEIATGFGRTGRMFACEHAAVAPDVLCVGKALSAGYLTLAAAAACSKVARVLSEREPGVFMHGPTYMANPLACAVASASLDLLAEGTWQRQVERIEEQLRRELEPCSQYRGVRDVRVKGAIGVVEMKQAVDVAGLCRRFVEDGVWIRPFANLIYVMPPYVIEPDDLSRLTAAIQRVCR